MIPRDHYFPIHSLKFVNPRWPPGVKNGTHAQMGQPEIEVVTRMSK